MAAWMSLLRAWTGADFAAKRAPRGPPRMPPRQDNCGSWIRQRDGRAVSARQICPLRWARKTRAVRDAESGVQHRSFRFGRRSPKPFAIRLAASRTRRLLIRCTALSASSLTCRVRGLTSSPSSGLVGRKAARCCGPPARCDPLSRTAPGADPIPLVRTVRTAPRWDRTAWMWEPGGDASRPSNTQSWLPACGNLLLLRRIFEVCGA
jgi:hypothetical protein